jgi:transposase
VSLEGLVTDSLNLPGIRTLRHVSSNDQHTYESISVEPAGEPCCDAWLQKRRLNGTKRQVFVDTPREGRPAIIHHKRRRWFCDGCGSTIYEDLPWAEVGRKMTMRMADWLFRQSIKRSFTSVAGDAGIDPGTVTDVFEEHAKPAVLAIRAKTPRVLGLDEKHIFGGFRAVMGDVEAKTMFWMLPARNNDTLAKFFDRIPDREKVEVVTIDMFAGYRKLLPDWFPEATLVIDKFHITRYATMAIDRARASLRRTQTKPERVKLMHQRWTLLRRRKNWQPKHYATFNKIADRYPDLAAIYEWKERACDIWELTDRRQAEQAYLAWRDELPGQYRIYFKQFTTAMKNWGPEIFNYFDHRYTNAYIERLNGMVDDANRIGRGYSYRVLFYKTMLQHGVPKKRPKRLIKSAELLDGVVIDGLRGSMFGLGELGSMMVWLFRALRQKRPASEERAGIPLATLSEGFRDPLRW